MDPVLLSLVTRTNLGTYREVQAIRETVNGLAERLPGLERQINTTIWSIGTGLAVSKGELLLRHKVSFNQDLRQLAFLLARILNGAGIDRNRLAEETLGQNDPVVTAIAQFLKVSNEDAFEIIKFLQRVTLEDVNGPVRVSTKDD